MADEELRAIDADHFWIGGVMVDLNQLAYEQNRMSLDRQNTDHQIHEIGVALSTLGNYARKLAAGKDANLESIKFALLRLNRAGLHTGYTEKS